MESTKKQKQKKFRPSPKRPAELPGLVRHAEMDFTHRSKCLKIQKKHTKLLRCYAPKAAQSQSSFLSNTSCDLNSPPTESVQMEKFRTSLGSDVPGQTLGPDWVRRRVCYLWVRRNAQNTELLVPHFHRFTLSRKVSSYYCHESENLETHLCHLYKNQL